MTGSQAVYIVDGLRTPFLKAKRGLGPFSASDLAVQAGRALLKQIPQVQTQVDEVIIGSAMPSPDEANIARLIGLRLGIADTVPAWTVMRNCASGLQALDNGFQSIALGRSELVLCGGTDAMSRAPLLLNHHMANWLSLWFTEKRAFAKLGLLTKVRPKFFAPVIGLLRGLTDPFAGINMGQTAENVAFRFQVSREQMDAFAAESHQRALNGQSFLQTQIVSIVDHKGIVYDKDTGVRDDCSVERLAKLKPFFDKKFGKVTAGNSSQITDGAAMLLLASADAVTRLGLPVIAKVTDVMWSGLSPEFMGLGPAHAIAGLLVKHQLSTADLASLEINEAFAAQVLGCVAALGDPTYCRDTLGLDAPVTVAMDRLNRNGGAIACGHPIGASGARVVLNLAKNLQQIQPSGAKGIASLCIGGGQGGAMLIESCQGVAA